MGKVNIKATIFLIISGFFAYFSGTSIAYSIFYTTLLLFIFSIVHVIIQKKTMNFSAISNKESFSTGEKLELQLIVSSFSAIPAAYMIIKNQGLKHNKKGYTGDATFMNFSYQKSLKAEIDFKVRGVYDFGINEVTFNDLFCLVKGTKKFYHDKSISVYPRIYEINQTNFNGKNIIQNAVKDMLISHDSNDVRDLRRYRIGDSIKNIHWKLSAKHNELYIKNFSEIVSKDTSLFLNMSIVGHDYEEVKLIEESMIDFTVSIVSFLKNKMLQTNLFINNKEERFFSIKRANDFQGLMDYFLEHKSLAEENFSVYMESKITRLEPGSWIGIITLIIDEKLTKQINKLINAGFKCSVFYCLGNNKASDEGISEHLEFIKY